MGDSSKFWSLPLPSSYSDEVIFANLAEEPSAVGCLSVSQRRNHKDEMMWSSSCGWSHGGLGGTQSVFLVTVSSGQAQD